MKFVPPAIQKPFLSSRASFKWPASRALRMISRLNRPLVLLWASLLLLGVGPGLRQANAATFYVSKSAPPGGDGTSWTTSFRDLHAALNAASSLPPLDTIRVGQGTYSPSEASDPPLTLPLRFKDAAKGANDKISEDNFTFNMSNPGIVAGGFAGFGTADPDERDVEQFETILSGDSVSDHVVVVRGNSRPLIDGFTIANGLYDSFDDSVLDYGQGMVVTGLSNPVVQNCTFRDNQGPGDGAGLSIDNGSSATIRNCKFIANRSTSGKGGGFSSVQGGVLLTNCLFLKNQALLDGGGVTGSGLTLINLDAPSLRET